MNKVCDNRGILATKTIENNAAQFFVVLLQYFMLCLGLDWSNARHSFLQGVEIHTTLHCPTRERVPQRMKVDLLGKLTRRR